MKKIAFAIIAVVVLAMVVGCDNSTAAAKPDLVGVKVYGQDNHPNTGSFVRGLLACGAKPANKPEEAQLLVSFEDLETPKIDRMVLVVRDARGSVLNSLIPYGSLDMSDEAVEFAEAYVASHHKTQPEK